MRGASGGGGGAPPPPATGLPVRAGAAPPALASPPPPPPPPPPAPRPADVETGGGGATAAAVATAAATAAVAPAAAPPSPPSSTSRSSAPHLDECGGAVAHASAPPHSASFGATLATLLALQLGWGLWLMPAALARLGWVPGLGAIAAVGAATAYSASLFSRLAAAVPSAVLLSDVAAAARGAGGRHLTTAIICTLDGLRCVILAQAGARSLAHAAGGKETWAGSRAGPAVAATVWALAQARGLADVSWFLTAGTVAQLGAVGVVVVTLLASPVAGATTRAVNWACDPVDGAIALLNVFFAFGGQVRVRECGEGGEE